MHINTAARTARRTRRSARQRNKLRRNNRTHTSVAADPNRVHEGKAKKSPNQKKRGYHQYTSRKTGQVQKARSKSNRASATATGGMVWKHGVGR